MSNNDTFFYLILTTGILFIFRVISLKLGLIDKPNHRKVHSHPVAIAGGISIYLVVLVFYIFSENKNLFLSAICFSSGLVVIVGLIDDKFNIKPIWRFLVQILSCLIVIYFSGLKIESFGYLLSSNWELELGLFALPITVFGLVGIINAVNMTDGIDGLAPVTFVIPLGFLIFLQESADLKMWMICLSIAVFVFFVFNQTRSYKVFLGDHGSLFLGFVLSWFLVYMSQDYEVDKKIFPVTALYFIGPALLDTIFVMSRRMIRGQSPFTADKSHVHHLLLKRGLTHRQSVGVLGGVILLFCSLGYVFVLLNLPESFQFYIFVSISGLYYLIMKNQWLKFES